MNTALNARIKQIRQALNLSQRAFAKKIFISQSYYSAIELERQEVNDRIIHIVSTRLNVNRDWIATGRGDMFRDSPPDVKLDELVQIFNELNGLFQEYILQQTKRLRKVQEKEQELGKEAG
jgi:transcriptional regulator with XRE-family HTH domain